MPEIKKILDSIDWSNKGLIKTIIFWAASVVSNFLDYAQITPTLVKALVMAMVIDTLLGARVASRLKKSYSTGELRAGIYEKGLYLGVFLGLSYISRSLGMNYEWLPTTMFTILVVAETFSFINHALSLKTKKVIEEVDFVTALLKVLKLLFKFVANTLLIKLKTSLDEEKSDKNKEEDK